MRILYVENHPRFARVAIQQFLASHEVVVVPSLAAARQALSQGSFETVLLDYDLDDDKGVELIPELQDQVPRPALVAVSSHSAGNEALMAAGADAVCSKMQFSRIGTVLAALPQATRR